LNREVLTFNLTLRWSLLLGNADEAEAEAEAEAKAEAEAEACLH